MGIRVRRPATTRLELTEGDYLLVKQDLTAGEFRDLMRASARQVMTPGPNGTMVATMEVDPVAGGLALVMAYLLDWSFADEEGRRLRIADQPAAVVRAALDNIDSEAYMEVQAAILAHQTARAAVLAEEKKTRSGWITPVETLASVG